MATYKVDLLIRQSTNLSGSIASLPRVGAWSEGWYFDGTAEEAKASAVAISAARANLLTPAAAVVGQRIRDSVGGSATLGVIKPGTYSLEADIPQMSLLIAAAGVGVVNVRRFHLRGIADFRVKEGEYFESSEFNLLIQDYADSLFANNMKFRHVDFLARTGNVDTIAANGDVLFSGIDPGFSAGNIVQGLHILSDANDRVITGKWTIQIREDGTYYLQAWNNGLAHAGKLRQVAHTLSVVDKTKFSVVRASTHKVGEDFFQFHGRR